MHVGKRMTDEQVFMSIVQKYEYIWNQNLMLHRAHIVTTLLLRSQDRPVQLSLHGKLAFQEGRFHCLPRGSTMDTDTTSHTRLEGNIVMSPGHRFSLLFYLGKIADFQLPSYLDYPSFLLFKLS